MPTVSVLRGIRSITCQKGSLVLTERRQSLTINKIEKPLGRAARPFPAFLPLLHRGLADTHNRRKHGLADMVRHADAPDILGPKIRLGDKQLNMSLRLTHKS